MCKNLKFQVNSHRKMAKKLQGINFCRTLYEDEKTKLWGGD